MVPSLLIMLREGFEAALIVALVFAYLRTIHRLDMVRAAWVGVAVAAVLAATVGVILHAVVGGLNGEARLRSFAVVSLLAAGVLTWMVFWMRRQAKAIKGDLEQRVDRALSAGDSVVGVAMVAFLAVLREGLEAALFLVAAATDASGGEVVLGAVAGLAIAIGLGWMVYAGGRRLPRRAFFQVTGIVVLVFAAGLLTRTVLFLQAVGDLGSVNDAVYDLTGYEWLTQGSEIGKFLAAMVGWDPRPSLEQVMVWVAYIVPIGGLFFFGDRRRRTALPTTEAERLDAT